MKKKEVKNETSKLTKAEVITEVANEVVKEKKTTKKNTKKPSPKKVEEVLQTADLACEELVVVEEKVSKLPFYKRWILKIKGWFIK